MNPLMMRWNGTPYMHVRDEYVVVLMLVMSMWVLCVSVVCDCVVEV